MNQLNIIASAIFKRDHAYELLEYSIDIFTDNKCKVVYNAIKELTDINEVIDFGTITAHLQNSKKLDGIGGAAFLAGLATNMPILNYEYCLKALEHEKHKRDIQDISTDIYKSIKSGSMEYEVFIEKLTGIYEKMHTEKKDNYSTIQEISNQKLESIFKRQYYHQTQYAPLDDMITGLFNGQLIVLAARPKKGKSCLALQLASNIGNTEYYSLEMKRTELYARLLASLASVESWKIEANKLEPEEKKRVEEAHASIGKKVKIKIYDKIFSFQYLVSTIKRNCEKEKPKAIFIDYLQLIRGAKGENQNIRISNITVTFKQLAMRYEIPIVLLSQLSRDSEKEGREPILSDLRDSGAIEQDADVIIFIHENKEKETSLIVAGNRKGRAGKIKGIKFNKPYLRFEFENIEKAWGEI
jgi:replicative DNA helicase